MPKFISFDEASELTEGQLMPITIEVYTRKPKVFTSYRRGKQAFLIEDEFLANLEDYRATHKCPWSAGKKEKAAKRAPDALLGSHEREAKQLRLLGDLTDYPLEEQVSNLRRLLIVAWQQISQLEARLAVEKHIC